MVCRGNRYHNFLACTCLSSTHTAARHKHTLVRIMSYYCCHVVAAQQACTATGVITSQCLAAVSPWQPLRSSLRADSLPRAAEAAGTVCVSKLPGGKDPPRLVGTQLGASLQGGELQSVGDALDLHCRSCRGGTGLAETPGCLLLSLPGPSACLLLRERGQQRGCDGGNMGEKSG